MKFFGMDMIFVKFSTENIVTTVFKWFCISFIELSYVDIEPMNTEVFFFIKIGNF